MLTGTHTQQDLCVGGDVLIRKQRGLVATAGRREGLRRRCLSKSQDGEGKKGKIDDEISRQTNEMCDRPRIPKFAQKRKKLGHKKKLFRFGFVRIVAVKTKGRGR